MDPIQKIKEIDIALASLYKDLLRAADGYERCTIKDKMDEKLDERLRYMAIRDEEKKKQSVPLLN